MTRIIYLDIDGTLRDELEGIPDSAKIAVQKCRQKGILILICTGRNPGSIQDDVRCMETDGVISGGGCYIEFKGELLKREHFSKKTLTDILEVIRKRNLGASLESEQEIYMNGIAAEFYREDVHRKISGENEQWYWEKNRIGYEDNFSQLWNERGKIHKICLIGAQEEIESVQAKFGEVSGTAQKKEWNGRAYIELLPPQCGKGRAVEFLNRYLGIKREESMSFGDGENDIEMLKSTGTGIAVSSGSPKLIGYADAVCESPLENGIYRELARRGIIEADHSDRQTEGR